MKTQNFIQSCIIDNIASAKYKRFLLAPGQIICIGTDSVKKTSIHTNVFSCKKRRQNMQAFCLPVQIPFFSRSQVIHQAVIVFLHDDTDVFNTCIHHAGNLKINDAKSCCYRERCDSSKRSQFAEASIIFTGIDYTHNILHVFIVLSVHKMSGILVSKHPKTGQLHDEPVNLFRIQFPDQPVPPQPQTPLPAKIHHDRPQQYFPFPLQQSRLHQ